MYIAVLRFYALANLKIEKQSTSGVFSKSEFTYASFTISPTTKIYRFERKTITLFNQNVKIQPLETLQSEHFGFRRSDSASPSMIRSPSSPSPPRSNVAWLDLSFYNLMSPLLTSVTMLQSRSDKPPWLRGLISAEECHVSPQINPVWSLLNHLSPSFQHRQDACNLRWDIPLGSCDWIKTV